jgi:hypothetical protein
MDSCEDVLIAVGCTFVQKKKREGNENRPVPSIFPWGRGMTLKLRKIRF